MILRLTTLAAMLCTADCSFANNFTPGNYACAEVVSTWSADELKEHSTVRPSTDLELTVYKHYSKSLSIGILFVGIDQDLFEAMVKIQPLVDQAEYGQCVDAEGKTYEYMSVKIKNNLVDM